MLKLNRIPSSKEKQQTKRSQNSKRISMSSLREMPFLSQLNKILSRLARVDQHKILNQHNLLQLFVSRFVPMSSRNAKICRKKSTEQTTGKGTRVLKNGDLFKMNSIQLESESIRIGDQHIFKFWRPFAISMFLLRERLLQRIFCDNFEKISIFTMNFFIFEQEQIEEAKEKW